MKTTVNEILAFCKEICESSGEANPEITYDLMTKALFPTQWKLDNYYLHRGGSYEDDDPDCYYE